MTNSNKSFLPNSFRNPLLLIGVQQILIVILVISSVIVNDKDRFVQYYAYAKSINPESSLPVVVVAILQSVAAISFADIMLLTCVACSVLSVYLCTLIIKGQGAERREH